jgi:predicted RNA binding protein YcfA (HicA-like mRNA interferase family)
MTPRLPRDVSGRRLAAALTRYGYAISRQTGSHMRLTSQTNGEHHITIPDHDPLKIGTLSAIVSEICRHMEITRNQLIDDLDL